MNIVFLSLGEPHHLYLINEINKHYPVKKVFFRAVEQKPVSLPAKIRKWIHPKRYGALITILLDRLLFGWEGALEKTYEGECFFGGTPVLNPAIVCQKVGSFNDPETVMTVRRESPDLIIVFGTEILKGEILRTAKINIFNIHRGILPKYRGGGIPEWVFYNKDFDQLGTTVHVCSERLDAGDIVGQKFYHLQKDDKIYMLRAKTTRLAVDILKEVIDKLKRGSLEYKKQEILKPWSSRDLTIVKKWKAHRNFSRYVRSLN